MTPGRRQPHTDVRVRDAERSRAALLDAAQTEFAEKGLAGARTNVIAARAGVNKQLIAYYFDGKQGLYDAVVERRRAVVAQFDTSKRSLPELARRYVQAFADNPELERIYLRETLDADPDHVSYDSDVDEVRDLQRRQKAGEIDADLDPAFVLLFLQAMTAAGALFPGEAKRLTGLDPRSTEFRNRVADQLAKIVSKLA